MGHGKRLIPPCGYRYEIFFKGVTQYVAVKTTPVGQTPAQWTHIPAAEITALNAAYMDWHTAYTPTLTPHTPAETAAMRAAYKRSSPVLSRFIQVWFRGFPDIVTDEDLLNMGIDPVDRIRTPKPKPSCQPEADVVYPGKHMLELVKIRRVPGIGDDPPGVDYGTRIFWGVMGESTAKDKFRLSAPPVVGDDLPHSTFTHRKRYRFDFEGDSGKTVWFCLRYENQKGGKEGEGPFGPLFQAIVP